MTTLAPGSPLTLHEPTEPDALTLLSAWLRDRRDGESRDVHMCRANGRYFVTLHLREHYTTHVYECSDPDPSLAALKALDRFEAEHGETSSELPVTHNDRDSRSAR